MPFIENYLSELCHIDHGVLLKSSKIIMPFTIFCIIWLDKKDKHKFLMKNIDLLIFLSWQNIWGCELILVFNKCVWCSMAFMETMHCDTPNITHFISIDINVSIYEWLYMYILI